MSGPWEKDRDADGRWMICDGPDTTVCRGISREADADLIAALHMVLADMDVCVGECGADYEFKELSEETVSAIRAAIAKSQPSPKEQT
jgi:hypothetical protein